jgi:hypothetical protein
VFGFGSTFLLLLLGLLLRLLFKCCPCVVADEFPQAQRRLWVCNFSNPHGCAPW